MSGLMIEQPKAITRRAMITRRRWAKAVLMPSWTGDCSRTSPAAWPDYTRRDDRLRLGRDIERGLRALRRARSRAGPRGRLGAAAASSERLDLRELQRDHGQRSTDRGARGTRAAPSGRRDRRSALLREAPSGAR